MVISSIVIVGAELQICTFLKVCRFKRTNYDCMEGGRFLEHFSFTRLCYWGVEGIT